MLAAWEKLGPLLGIRQGSTNWHNDLKYFYFEGEGPLGLVTFLPAWFLQGHNVSALADKLIISGAYPEPENVSKIPKAFCKFHQTCCIGLAKCYFWIQRNSECHPGGINPALYDAGWEKVKCLRATPEIGNHILNWWASIFSSVSVISNHNTLVHRDSNSR